MNPITDSHAATGETYDPATHTMTVRYKGNPHDYRYANVTPEMYADFQAAPSKGQWLGRLRDKTRHPFTKVAAGQ